MFTKVALTPLTSQMIKIDNSSCKIFQLNMIVMYEIVTTHTSENPSCLNDSEASL
jgi:hypothetical protein